jgi:L-ascorbate metabolism protein UlaG (beta-lactamase superfamily)
MSRAKFLRQTLFDIGRSPARPVAKPEPSTWRDDSLTGSVLGHSTVLMNFLGLVVLTDPVFSTRAGPGLGPFVIGPKRYLHPALKRKDVPAPDLIVLSHAHFDHLDTRSLRSFDRHTPIVTARETGDLLHRLGFREVHELDWGESTTVTTRHGPLRATGIEVAHWGARFLKDHHRGYNGYVLEREGRAVCFAGDTAYTPAFARLKDPRHPIELMLVPIGAYDPWIRAHCSPEQAAAMADQAGAKHFVPIHHQTFKLSSEPMDEPAARIRAAFAREPGRLLAVNVGETFHVPLG